MVRFMAGLVIWFVCLLGAVIGLAWMLCSLLVGGERYMRIAVAFDCAASACFGGDGHTTISNRAYSAEKAGRRWGCILCKLLDSIDPNHCENA